MSFNLRPAARPEGFWPKRIISFIAPRTPAHSIWPPAAVFATDYLRQRIAATDAVQKAKCVANIALPAGVGADDDVERADAQRLVGEVLEIDESN